MTDTTSEAMGGALHKLLLFLENDVDALGWDQPAAIYVVVGTHEDPRLEKALEVNGHPCDTLQLAYDHGMRLKDSVLGIAMANEGWRHKTIQEILATDDPTISKMGEDMMVKGRELFPELSEEDLIESAAQNYMQMMAQFRPSSLPDLMRVEMRNVLAVFRDGSMDGVMRDRDGEPQIISAEGRALEGGRVPSFMFQFLMGERPEDSEDGGEG